MEQEQFGKPLPETLLERAGDDHAALIMHHIDSALNSVVQSGSNAFTSESQEILYWAISEARKTIWEGRRPLNKNLIDENL